MIEKLTDHYAFTNPSSIYDEESLTALELVGRLGNAINDVINLVNKNELTIEEAYQYLVDNLPDSVEKAVEKLKNSGDLETILVKAVSNGKVDKDGVGQINYAMLAQDIREMFTGGNTPVVGDNAVSTSNIVDKSITENKMKLNVIDTVFYSDTKEAYNTPLIIINNDGRTASINPKYTYKTILIARDNHFTIDVSTLAIDTTEWTEGYSIDMYYNPSTKVVKIVTAFHRSETVRQCVYLGGIYGSELVCTTIIPVLYDNRFYIGGHKNIMSSLPMSSYRPEWYDGDKVNYKPSTAYFDINMDTSVVTINSTKTIPLPVQGKIYALNFSTVKTKVESIGGHTCVWFNPVDNELCFANMNTTYWVGKDNCLFLGVIVGGSGNTCIIPHTVNGTMYFNTHVQTRPVAQLFIANSNNTGCETYAKVDFKKRELVFPEGSTLYHIMSNQYVRMNIDSTQEYRVPFTTGNYQYLVGGENGLKFVGVGELVSGKYDIDGVYYLGFVNCINNEIKLTFNAKKVLTVSILGDSVSTFVNKIPTGNANFYTVGRYGVDTYHETWWGRVLDRCGLSLCVNNSWSGAKVTDSDPSKSFVERARLLDNGTAPDIIFVYGGYNDYTNNVDTVTFSQSYNSMLYILGQMYPETKIYCMTLPYFNRARTDNKTVQAFNNVIKEVCEKCHVEVIDLSTCGIWEFNGQTYCGDYNAENGQCLHPNDKGMKLIANKVIKSVLDSKEVS